METQTKQIIEQCAKASNDGTAYFGDIVATLMGAGVESYFVDYRNHQTTYYTRSDETLTTDLPGTNYECAQMFDAAAVQAAIRGAQRGEVMYPEFKRLSQEAGCIGYIVWLAGEHVTYFGRRGETHVERFPAKAASL